MVIRIIQMLWALQAGIYVTVLFLLRESYDEKSVESVENLSVYLFVILGLGVLNTLLLYKGNVCGTRISKFCTFSNVMLLPIVLKGGILLILINSYIGFQSSKKFKNVDQ